MKRVCLIWALTLLSIVCLAQNSTEHLKFMGIPLNGTIAQFQSKLLAKGCTLDKELSRSLPVGQRAFNGLFASNQVTIAVFFDAKSQVVYRAKAIIMELPEERADQEFENFKELLSRKYGSTWCFTDTKDENKNIDWLIPSANHPPREDALDDTSKSLPDAGFIGAIRLYITQNDNYRTGDVEFNVHVDYHDAINEAKQMAKDMEDL